MKLSVIVAAHNEERHLGAQLEALHSQDDDGDWDVIVIDNNSTDSTAEIVESVAAQWPRLRLVSASERSDRSYAWNVGLAQSDAEGFVFTDADDVVTSGWLRAARTGLAEEQLITGPLDVWSLNPPALAQSRGQSAEHPVGSFEGLFPVVRGANFAMRRSLWDQLGPFPEGAYPLDDTDLSFRARRLGVAVVGCPDMVIQYRYRGTSAELWRQGTSYGRSRCQFVRKLIDSGEPRPPRFAGWKSWLHLVVTVPRLADADRRPAWVWNAANRFGQLRGSIEQRLVYL